MRCAVLFALVAIGSAIHPLHALGQNDLPTHADGYEDKPEASDGEQKASPGYVGMTEVISAHSVGNKPTTAANSYDTQLTISNLVQSCPQADGTVEGTGELTEGVDYKLVHAGVTNFLHVNTSAKAKYKGTVGDDATLKDPVIAEIDYVFDQSGSTRQQNGVMTTTPPSHDSEHITMQVHAILNKLDLTFVGYSGGDPNSIHFERALGMTMAITYFGGVFYAMAETGWLQADSCAKIVFDPPSRSRMPVLGSDVKVNGFITTRGGQGVRGSFVDLRPLLGGGSVTAGTTQGDSPAKVDVNFDQASGSYSIVAGFGPFAPGSSQSSSCIRDKCTAEVLPFYIASLLPGIGGTSDDLNHEHGSQTTVTPNIGRSGKGQGTLTVTWDLARQGTTK